ncbi:hypothetical protein TGRUB_316380 [Toxoplasma gondii RUB]|uniref:Uncharacterized protein n=1 Tax=Toxoplasma gondii RUB TaxID=935652 RepID=A0A086MC27_TOXGO|nr:hypothetical protein TGRUB_316380 [Toxoplasma gondii RUB]
MTSFLPVVDLMKNRFLDPGTSRIVRSSILQALAVMSTYSLVASYLCEPRVLRALLLEIRRNTAEVPFSCAAPAVSDADREVGIDMLMNLVECATGNDAILFTETTHTQEAVALVESAAALAEHLFGSRSYCHLMRSQNDLLCVAVSLSTHKHLLQVFASSGLLKQVLRKCCKPNIDKLNSRDTSRYLDVLEEERITSQPTDREPIANLRLQDQTASLLYRRADCESTEFRAPISHPCCSAGGRPVSFACDGQQADAKFAGVANLRRFPRPGAATCCQLEAAPKNLGMIQDRGNKVCSFRTGGDSTAASHRTTSGRRSFSTSLASFDGVDARKAPQSSLNGGDEEWDDSGGSRRRSLSNGGKTSRLQEKNRGRLKCSSLQQGIFPVQVHGQSEPAQESQGRLCREGYEEVEQLQLGWLVIINCLSERDCREQIRHSTFLRTIMDFLQAAATPGGVAQHDLNIWHLNEAQNRTLFVHAVTCVSVALEYMAAEFVELEGLSLLIRLIAGRSFPMLMKAFLNMLLYLCVESDVSEKVCTILLRPSESRQDEHETVGTLVDWIREFSSKEATSRLIELSETDGAFSLNSQHCAVLLLATLGATGADARAQLRECQGLCLLVDEFHATFTMIDCIQGSTSTRYLLCLVECIWVTVVGDPENEEVFLHNGGLDVMLEALQVVPRTLQRHVCTNAELPERLSRVKAVDF